MKKIIVFAGSNSSSSINKILAKHAASLMINVEVEYINLEDYEPAMFGEDLEKEIGTHDKIKALVAKFDEADGVIMSTPEHNSMPPAFFKNILDWLSRTASQYLDGRGYLEGKPTLIMATSPGRGGAKGALVLVSKMVNYGKANIIGEFSFPSFNHNFENGEIVNEELKDELQSLINQLADKL